MKARFISLLLALSWGGSVFAQPMPYYENRGAVDNPQIDATTVVNFGTISTSSSLPFDTQDTLFFTNMPSGLINGSVGFNFDFSGPAGRGPSSAFINRGQIQADDSLFGIIFFLDFTSSSILGGGSYTLVRSDYVKNSGLLAAGAQGIVKVEGDYVDLTRGGLRASTPPSQSDFGNRGLVLGGTNFNNISGVVDLNWRVDTNANVFIPSLISQTANYQPFVYTNQYDATNFLVQMVFVATNRQSTNLTADVRFAPGTASSVPSIGWIDETGFFPPDPGTIAVVQYGLPDVDIASGRPITNFVYLLDTSALEYMATNYGMSTNTGVIRTTQRPAAYEITLTTPFEWILGQVTNAAFTNTLIYGPDSVTNVATNFFAQYSAGITLVTGDNNASGSGGYLTNSAVGDIGFLNPSNWYGRVEVAANNLDLTLTRIRGSSLVSITASNLISSQGFTADAPHIQLNFGSTNGFLTISNSILPTVKRLTGTVSAKTYTYTNQIQEIVGGATNLYNFKYCILIVDNNLTGVQTVSLDKFELHSTNVVVADQLYVNSSFLIDAENVLLRTNVYLSFDSLTNGDVAARNFPRLENLTNEGSLNVPNVMRLGSDRQDPISAIVNRGLLYGSSALLRATNLENSGSIVANGGPVSIEAEAVKLDNGSIIANGTLEIDTTDLKAHSTSLNVTNGALVFNVTNRLSDGGIDAASHWVSSDGISLLSKPQTGDLLGTEIYLYAPTFASVESVWAGENRGTNASGYTNNVAIGRLVLDGGPLSEFTFSGTGTNNALYVDYLVLTNAATNISSLFIDTNLVVYFAAANLPSSQLDGQFDGRLRWISSYAGANSSTNITLNSGQVITVNLNLLSSTTVDSDGDGIVNALDSSPFDGVRISDITVTNVPPPMTLISWTAAAQTAYQVQYATNLIKPTWQPLLSITNTAITNRVLTIQDPTTNEVGQRFYRVNYNP